jgi:hypothetical protein
MIYIISNILFISIDRFILIIILLIINEFINYKLIIEENIFLNMLFNDKFIFIDIFIF